MNEEYFASINEVSKNLDIPAHTLRYWEKQFVNFVKPVTGIGGRRYYRPETIVLLKNIKELLYEKGMTIAGVKKILKTNTLKLNESQQNNTIETVIELLTLAKHELSN